MKKTAIAFAIGTILLGSLSTYAQTATVSTCQETDLSIAAGKLRLSGRVEVIQNGDLQRKESNIAQTLSKTSEEYKEIEKMVSKDGFEIISKAYGLLEDGEVAVVVRNKTDCNLIQLFGTDGEDSLYLGINTIGKSSITFDLGRATVTIQKVKSSRSKMISEKK